jgi:hypothetical protein
MINREEVETVAARPWCSPSVGAACGGSREPLGHRAPVLQHAMAGQSRFRRERHLRRHGLGPPPISPTPAIVCHGADRPWDDGAVSWKAP